MSRSSLRFSFLLFCFGLLLPNYLDLVAQDAPNRPNVLMIAIDDLNDWIEPLGGHPQTKTPNLNRLAKMGTCFSNAHCQAPICNPSRISLLIGKLPSSTGIYYLGPRLRQCETTKTAITLPQHFQRHGYKTLAAGKIFHGGGKGEFETYAGSFGGFGPRPRKPINGGQTHPLWDWGEFPRSTEQMPDKKIADWTIKQLGEKHEQPFFLACGFYRPHVPLFVPPKWFKPFPLEKVKLPPSLETDFKDIPSYANDLSWSAVAPRHQWMVDNQQWTRATQAYLASIHFVDAQVGRILDALEASPHRDNTLIVLWSDHGFHVGSKERWGKRSLWEDSTRVVMMMAGKGIKPGQTCGQPVGLIDIYPTLIDLCGLRQRTGLEGHSLRPLLEHANASWDWPAITTFGKNNHSVRGKQFRYTIYADGSEELYNLFEDREEFSNLAGDPNFNPVKRRLRSYLPQINHEMAEGSHNADARPGSAAEIPADRARRMKKSREKK